MHEVLANRLGGLSLPRKSVVRLTDRPDMTLDVYRGRKTKMQQQLLVLASPLRLDRQKNLKLAWDVFIVVYKSNKSEKIIRYICNKRYSPGSARINRQ